MSPPPTDPYRTLGVSPRAGDAELRAAYRRLVQRHHPDHNGGSPESARRFEEVQEAYARIRELRGSASAPPPPPGKADPAVDSRLAEMERELSEARRVQARAAAQARRQEAAEAARRSRLEAERRAAEGRARRPSDEELGYIRTEDSFTRIFDDLSSEVVQRFDEARREHRAPRKLADLIDELGSKLTGDDES